jgi:nitric oxide reductase large subunit
MKRKAETTRKTAQLYGMYGMYGITAIVLAPKKTLPAKAQESQVLYFAFLVALSQNGLLTSVNLRPALVSQDVISTGRSSVGKEDIYRQYTR